MSFSLRVKNFIKAQLALILAITLFRFWEFSYLNQYLDLPKNAFIDNIIGIANDIQFILLISIALFIIYFFISLISYKIAKLLLNISNVLVLISESLLIIFFAQRGSALDHELVQQSVKESMEVVKNSGGFQLDNFLLIAGSIFLYFIFKLLVFKRLKFSSRFNAPIITLILIVLVGSFFSKKGLESYNESFQLRSNKTAFLLSAIFDYELNSNEKHSKKQLLQSVEFYQQNVDFDFVSKEYPLLHKNDFKDVLGPFIKPLDSKPNIVFIIVESLSSSMSGSASENHGLITPYFDSLTTQGLYWSNCLSSSEISFEVLPSVLASAPYGKEGFNMIPKIPEHQSIIKTLNKNDYFSAFISGSPIYFANQGAFMRNQHTNFIINKFDNKYERIKNNGNWSWGYSDDVLFRQGLDLLDSVIKPPYINVYVTITSHPPYVYPGSGQYQANFVKFIEQSDMSKDRKAYFIKQKKMFAAFRSFDDELKHFIESYKKRDDYKNTLFIITGDHQGYFKVKNAADNFRVPLLIYGAPIKKAVHFESVVLHAQLAPSLSNNLHANYQIDVPKYIDYLAGSLDTCREFRNLNAYPFIYANKDIRDYIYKDYYLNAKSLFKIKGPSLDLVPSTNDSIRLLMIQLLKSFKDINHEVSFNNKLLPDSLYEYTNVFKDTIYQYKEPAPLNTQSMFPLGSHFALNKLSGTIEVSINFQMKTQGQSYKRLPHLVITIEDSLTKDVDFYDSKELKFLTEEDIVGGKWIQYNTTDLINLNDISLDSSDIMKFYIYNSQELELKYKDFEVQILK